VDDAERIQALMRASTRDLFRYFYDAQQIASAVVHIAQLDVALIEDGTYFVHAANGELVACGGWSRRAKLYADGGELPGDDRPLDPASEPARVRAMFVRSDWIRRGLGRALLESCERAARAEGFARSSSWRRSPANRSTVRSASRRSDARWSPCPTVWRP
jgi:GNAT superfamily N-acetyltransferase